MPKFLTVVKLVFILTFFFCQSSFSQKNNNTIETDLVALFNKRIASQKRLINGVAYIDYAGKLDGNAYLHDNNDFTNETLIYDDVEFLNVPILYDIVQDKVVTLLSNGYTKYSLINERLSSFTIRGDKYIYYTPSVDSENPLSSGFYKQVYANKISVLVKNSKTVKEIVDVYGARKKFSGRIDYYLLFNKKLQRVAGDSDIYRVLGVEKSEYKKYLKSKDLKFKREPEQTLVAAVSFYEQRIK